MPVTLLCPHCGAPSRFDSPELKRCRACGEALPEALLETSARAYQRQDAASLALRLFFRGTRNSDYHSVTLVCPGCGLPSRFDQTEPKLCTSCGEELPAELGDAVEVALWRQRPLGLTIGMWLSAAMGALFFVSGTCVDALLLFGVMSEPPPGNDPLSLVAYPLIGFLLLAIAFGIHTERGWVRPLATGFWLFPVPFALFQPDVSAGELAFGTCWMLFPAAIAGWYFYVNRTTVLYYRGLPLERRSR